MLLLQAWGRAELTALNALVQTQAGLLLSAPPIEVASKPVQRSPALHVSAWSQAVRLHCTGSKTAKPTALQHSNRLLAADTCSAQPLLLQPAGLLSTDAPTWQWLMQQAAWAALGRQILQKGRTGSPEHRRTLERAPA